MNMEINGFILSDSHYCTKKAAFTLAETMIVIVVLGIIATLTIPALVNKNKESVAKTKVRKAMAAYESAINKMIIENDLKSNTALTEWGNITNCTNSTNYFKKSKDVNGCIFKTTDGIWWNIDDITRPVISFKEITTQNEEQITANANNADDKTAFVLVGHFGNDGSLRVDDLAYETANSIEDASGNQSKAQVEKLYTLLGMKKSSGGGGNASPFAACNHADTCVVNGIEYTKVTIETANEKVCIHWEWDEESNLNYCDNWSEIIPSTETKDIWISDITAYLNEIDAKSDDTCAEARNESWCKEWGDYQVLAKKICGENAHPSTSGELVALYNLGLLNDDCYYASEAYPGDIILPYNFCPNNGTVFSYSGGFYPNTTAICVGN